MDSGAITSLLRHPLPSAMLVLDADGAVVLANPAAQALGLDRSAAHYAQLLADLRQRLREGATAIPCSLPGPSGRLDGWMRAVAGEGGGAVAYTVSVPEPDGASRWQAALDSAGHGLWDWDVAGNRTFRSRSWRAMLGYEAGSGDDALDEGLDAALSLVHPEDIARVRERLADHLEGRTPTYVCEHRLRHRDGSWRWVRDSGRVIASDANGRPLRMVGTHTEIGTQKQLEQRLRDQQWLLEETQRIAGTSSWAWDPDSDVVWCSPELRALAGLPEDATGSRAWVRRIGRHSAGELRKAWRRIRQDGRLAHFEIELATPAEPDGLHLLIWAQPQLDPDGNLQRVLAQVQDVTGQRRVDALIRSRTELLARVSALGGIGGAEIDPATRRMQWTEECARLHGMAPGPVVLDEVLALYTTASREAFEAALVRAADGGAPERVEGCFYRGSGERVWVQVVIELDRDEGGPARHIVLFRDITRERETSARIEMLSHYDPLTGLPNRGLLRRQAEEALAADAGESRLAMLLVDIDGFRGINESFGHGAGDAVLKASAARMHQCLGGADLFGRLGADEFAVLLSGARDRAAVGDAASRLIAALGEPLHVGTETLKIGASVGIAVRESPGDGFDDLLRAAGVALCAARQHGRGNHAFYTQEALQQARRRLKIEHALRGALDRDEFSVVYQPLVHVDSATAPGIEALLRWHRPAGGHCGPAEFIPIAEECGEIVRLGDWVISEACRQAAAWEEAGLRFGRMSVNVSAVQLRDRGFAERVIARCEQAGWPPHRLELELTESALVRDTEILHECFATLQRHGVSLAVDDFGTGFSNLHYLNRFPVSRLKIDRSLILDIQRSTASGDLTRAIIQLGQAMRMQVVVEGVETAIEERLLRQHGCDEIQGYLYTRPLPPREMAQWLRGGMAQGGAEPIAIAPTPPLIAC
ncbi:EAL domain-containing protein [Luteimonas sp. RD2P54]|uniref:EAL domain-containing protein n=1 Tax=Luteimonas endophytica TaxID=3042023 RepID=A0ABT6J7D5_9GAMM|nr:EAL domain-containing protein [Luteimonas endophytica]MDH5822736.1 EAL domain-containing protein [Luteimonas endophytica]